MRIRAMKKQSQNKPNLLDAQMNVSSILTKDYGRNDIFAVPENKANSNPACRGVAPSEAQSPQPRFYPKNQRYPRKVFFA